MGERERGRAAILKAAEALARLDAGKEGSNRCEFAGAPPSVSCSTWWNGRRKPSAHIDRALERCERYAARQPTSDRLALLATCRLAKAEVALAIGDPRAEELAQRGPERPCRASAARPRVAAALYAVGAARVDRGEGGDALKFLQEADTLLERAFPKGTPAQAVLALTLAATYQQLGETEAGTRAGGPVARIVGEAVPQEGLQERSPEADPRPDVARGRPPATGP